MSALYDDLAEGFWESQLVVPCGGSTHAEAVGEKLLIVSLANAELEQLGMER